MDEDMVSHQREGLVVWTTSFAVLVISTMLYLIFLWIVYMKTPKFKRWTFTFWISAILLFFAALNTFITIRHETHLLLKTLSLKFKLWEYTIPHFITLFVERTLGEFALLASIRFSSVPFFCRTTSRN
ncbi:hypothetical protein BKA69DRAFT_671389 [Paraphysoderma sedebokerense]|nr:hypothetical protein BKA69DRAFT_671389 [Paraphysoderma sedebokerense]